MDQTTVVLCNDGRMWLHGFQPACCGILNRKNLCGKFFICDKCKRAFSTCQELGKHKRLTGG